MADKEKLLAAVQKQLEKGQIQKAIKDLETVVQIDPRDVRHRQKLADLYSRAKMNTEAFAAYEVVAKNYSDNGFNLKAIAVYKQMQKIDPSQPTIYLRLAELNQKQGLAGNALAEYDALVEFYEKAGKHLEAAGILQKMAELDPENLGLKIRAAEGYCRGGLKEKGLAALKETSAALKAKGEFEKLRRVYEMFQRIFPDDIFLQAGLGQALIFSGDAERGLPLLQGLLKKDPDNAEVLSSLAQGYRRLKDFENERLTLKHLLKVGAGDLAQHQGYVRACLDAGGAERALEHLEQVRELFVKAGQAAALVDFYERLHTKLPGNPKVVRTLQGLYESTGKGDKLFDLMNAGPEGDSGDFSAASEVQEVEELEELEELPEVEEFEELETIEEMEPLEELEEAPADFALPETFDGFDGAGSLPEDDLGMEESGESGPELLEEVELGMPLEEDGLDLEMEIDLDLDEEDSGGGELGLFVDDERASGERLPDPGEEGLPELSLGEEGFPVDLEGEVPEFGSQEIDLAPEESDESPGLEITAAEPELDGSFLGGYGEELDLTDGLAVEEISPQGKLSTPGPQVAPLDLDLSVPEDPDRELLLDEAAPVDLDLGEAVVSAEAGLSSGGPGLDLDLDLNDEPSPARPAPARNLAAELEEADFYLQQGLFDEAEAFCLSLLEEVPGAPEVHAKLEEIGQRRQRAAEQPEAEEEGDFFDLAAEVMNESAFDAGSEMESLDERDLSRLDGLLSEFKKGVERQVSQEDTETHYNLGIAYKEMGLLDDAIAEFDRVQRGDPKRASDCLTLKGICYAERGEFPQAEKAFREGLALPQLSPPEQLSIFYELGMVYQAWGRSEEALKSFEQVSGADAGFRDVAEKLEELRQQAVDREQAGGGKSRISYV